MRSLLAVLALGGAGLWFFFASGASLRHPPSSAAPTAVVAMEPEAFPRDAPLGAAKSIAAVACQRSVGTGVFVGDERLLTNAHVLCPGAEPPRVWLADGRDIIATVVQSDPWLDLALLEVPGASVSPLPLADAAALGEGAPAYVASVRGAEDLRAVRVRAVGRNHLGIGMLQFDGPVWPGDSGAALVDPRGQLVGVVSMLAFDSQGMGLALPVNYAATGGFVRNVELESPVWQALLERVGRADERDREAIRRAFTRPGLVAARLETDGSATATLLARWPSGAPQTLEADLAVRRNGRELCRQVVAVARWEPLGPEAAALSEARMLRWLTQHHLEESLFLGEARVPARCIPKRRPDGLELVLEQGDQRAWRVGLH
ncbi:MAG: serine protease [Myxococcales bacterium]